MLQAHRIRLNPTPEQATYFMKAAGTSRYAYNWAVERWNEAEESQKPSAMQLKKLFNSVKPPWVYEVTKCAAEGAFFDFADALTNYYKGRANEPRFKSRRQGHFSFYLANDKFDVSGHWLKVPKLGLVNMAEKLRLKGKIVSATLSKEARWWYVSITVDVPDKVRQASYREIGVDAGILRLATLSDGTAFINKRPLQHAQIRLVHLQRQLAKKQQDSHNYLKLKDKIAILHKYVHDKRNDLLHKLTTYITDEYGTIAVEDLNIVGMMKNHHLAQSLSDAALGQLARLLQEKTTAHSGRLVKIDRFFPSTKRCFGCGKEQEISLNERVYRCSECGFTADRDINAALNILEEGLRLLGESRRPVVATTDVKSPLRRGTTWMNCNEEL